MRTGVCTSDDYGFSLSYRAVLDQQELCEWLRQQPEKEVHIVYEMFRIYSTHAEQLIMQELFAPETIGMIKAIAWEKGWTLSGQWASQAKQAVDNKLLEKRGYNFTSKNTVGIKNSEEVRHAKDSGRHLLYYVDFSKSTS
ncbi:hypothetical protein D3C78_18430 [compost metagenome]